METKTPETEPYDAATHAAAINKHRRAKAAKQTLLTVVLAALIGAVVGLGAYALTPKQSLDDLTVDQVCGLLMERGGVPEDCTRMYRLEVVPNQPAVSFNKPGSRWSA